MLLLGPTSVNRGRGECRRFDAVLDGSRVRIDVASSAPPRQRGEVARRDRAFLLAHLVAHLDGKVACLDTCCRPERLPPYSPIRSGSYLLGRLRATY